MIIIDRPGCGGTGQVPLGERIERSCGTDLMIWFFQNYRASRLTNSRLEMAVSVLEFLMIKPAHILASSAGI